MVSLIDSLKLQFGLLWQNFAPKLHWWTLNHQHVCIECELKKISQLYRPMLMMTINYRFVTVRSNCSTVTQQRGKFAKGFRCEAFQNTANARIETEIGPRSTSYISRFIDFGVKISQKYCKSYQCIQKKSQFGAVYGPYFSKDAETCNVTVNVERYREVISNPFLPKMQNLDLHDGFGTAKLAA